MQQYVSNGAKNTRGFKQVNSLITLSEPLYFDVEPKLGAPKMSVITVRKTVRVQNYGKYGRFVLVHLFQIRVSYIKTEPEIKHQNFVLQKLGISLSWAIVEEVDMLKVLGNHQSYGAL